MGDAFSGTEGRITIGGTAIRVTSWEAEENTDYEESTDTGSAGKKEEEPINSQITGSGTFLLRKDSDWVIGPTLVAAGKLDGSKNPIRAAIKLYLQHASGPNIDLPVANIKRVRITSNQRGLVSGTFEFASHGTYTIPTSFSSS